MPFYNCELEQFRAGQIFFFVDGDGRVDRHGQNDPFGLGFKSLGYTLEERFDLESPEFYIKSPAKKSKT